MALLLALYAHRAHRAHGLEVWRTMGMRCQDEEPSGCSTWHICTLEEMFALAVGGWGNLKEDVFSNCFVK